MGLIEEITKMQKEGKSDTEIAGYLQSKGITPRDIQNALGQAQVKQAIAETEPPQELSGGFQGMQPSMLEQMQHHEVGLPVPTPSQKMPQLYMPEQPAYAEAPPQQTYAAEEPPQAYEQQPPSPETQYYQPQEEYGQQPEAYQGQDQQGYYQPSSGLDTETITEIAEQIVEDKTEVYRRMKEEYTEFKTLLKTKVENIDSRIHRLEQVMDKLQLALLDKVGEYVGEVDGIRKEMGMMQESSTKMIPSRTEHLSKLREMSEGKTAKRRSK